MTALARAIARALDTLPGEYYAIIREVVENWFPWLTLAVVAGKIVIPRYQYTVELWAERTSGVKPDKANDPKAPGPFSRTTTVNPNGEFGKSSVDGADASGTHGYNKYGASGNFRSGLN